MIINRYCNSPFLRGADTLLSYMVKVIYYIPSNLNVCLVFIIMLLYKLT